MAQPNLEVDGQYIPGHRTLTPLSPDAIVGTPSCTAQSPQGSCSETFRLNEDAMHGFFVYVAGLTDGELTLNPANDLSNTEAQFSFGVTVPKPTKG
jgi:hypothetical protein